MPPDQQHIDYSELLKKMADCSLKVLNEKKFGKKRISKAKAKPQELNSKSSEFTPPPELQGVKSKSRYISQALKYHIYQRDGSKCTRCGNMKNLNIDHIKPLGRGGFTEVNNLRLLCFSCNQRAAIKGYGLTRMLEYKS